jgi:hypothetical protein
MWLQKAGNQAVFTDFVTRFLPHLELVKNSANPLNTVTNPKMEKIRSRILPKLSLPL